ncbi:hypothetical protein [Brevundimonas sp.]|uniref:hypothetical protein n=1 Tax=Brevundimonas sp. TaxID=1871086 RepID=UPI003563F063
MGVLTTADGTYRWLGNAPKLNPARVEAIPAAYDDADVATFGEPARAPPSSASTAPWPPLEQARSRTPPRLWFKSERPSLR